MLDVQTNGPTETSGSLEVFGMLMALGKASPREPPEALDESVVVGVVEGPGVVVSCRPLSEAALIEARLVDVVDAWPDVPDRTPDFDDPRALDAIGTTTGESALSAGIATGQNDHTFRPSSQ